MYNYDVLRNYLKPRKVNKVSLNLQKIDFWPLFYDVGSTDTKLHRLYLKN